MAKYKLSQWHDGNVKPVHIGVYKRISKSGKMHYSLWNGRFWCLVDKTIAGAADNKFINMESFVQSSPWRGIVK